MTRERLVYLAGIPSLAITTPAQTLAEACPIESWPESHHRVNNMANQREDGRRAAGIARRLKGGATCVATIAEEHRTPSRPLASRPRPNADSWVPLRVSA